MAQRNIVIKGAREHNLKNISFEIPRDRLIVFTGISGSGKSSLAFDTLYAEGQRRYVESLSAYARQFLEQMDKPDVDSIEGLSPAISIEQKTTSKNPRSTVGTVTEIYDHLRLLYARVGRPHCYKCGRPIASQTIQQMVDRALALPLETRIQILAPIVRGRKGEYRKELADVARRGFVRARVDGRMADLSEPIHLHKNLKHDIDVVVDRLVIRRGAESRLADSLETALRLADGLATLWVAEGEEILFSEKFACPDCGISFPELSPRMFSFNSPYGACEACSGLGSLPHVDPGLVVPDPSLSLRQGAIRPWAHTTSVSYLGVLEALAGHYGFSLDAPFGKLPARVRKVLLEGSGEEEVEFFHDLARRRQRFRRPFDGVLAMLERRYRETASPEVRQEIEGYMTLQPCPACQGQRLRPESRAVLVGGRGVGEVAALSVKEARRFFGSLALTPHEMQIAERILREIRDRLEFLSRVGLDYLTLDRRSSTLAGGEAQRIRLATQVGASLVGVLYILDEPSIGLHQRDNRRLLHTLMRLRDLGNTVIVVEHDAETILTADYVLDLGPGAGRHGGYIVARGTPAEIMAHPDSLTGQYLSGALSIPVPERRRVPDGRFVSVLGASENNLKDLDVRFPLGVFTCVTGVSGSGKSTLVTEILYKALARRFYRSAEPPGRHRALEGVEHIDKVVDIDQSPIGRTPRSNPATYTGVFTFIRDLFAQVPEARKRGYKPGRFSFNIKGGRCEACQGDGLIRVEMHFLPDLYVTCQVCKGRRFNRETLEVLYKGQSIADVLDMTVDQALEFFENVPIVRDKLQTLRDVGLGYLRLGQSATTLSGGEAQRVKLSRELSKRATGRTLYILDEPTTGLHFADVRRLLEVLHRLTDAGNTVVVIEHNLEVIKTADHIIDLGPEGGDEGGRVVAVGTPEEVAEVPGSETGVFLRRVLNVPELVA
ncbi:MAG: excinuclease ABC subunit UvrA [Candidatus Tectomicrobia bacterium]|nr:excinuclease ABC subunit UvrA [Candidatus Tectomicrobia bacterium]